ncbi:hypothetical protein COO91_10368 (plasmid) [Nostoc flagelliforme CCNUN1]|uniref:Uncharacterized protein n=1 Tax=Nostoc flagelliforme CCNUN1 TaxID=2038116 RepID=A0A2K8T8Y0_9NOSO|nr:hypothetical protein COO91_10368 [Nostoc flagelliforme CCNUN1]
MECSTSDAYGGLRLRDHQPQNGGSNPDDFVKKKGVGG